MSQRHPKATILNLCSLAATQARIKKDAHYDACKKANVPLVRVSKSGRFFRAELDMISATYRLSEVGEAKLHALSDANDLMIWARHPTKRIASGFGPLGTIIDCISEEVAMATAEALALIASEFSISKDLAYA